MRLYRYFPHGIIIVHRLIASSIRRRWQYSLFKYNDVAYLITSGFNIIPQVLGKRYFLRLNFLFKLQKPLKNLNQLVLAFGWAKEGATH